MEKNNIFRLMVICILLIIVAAIVVFMIGSNNPQDSRLLKEYQDGFKQCASYCKADGNLTGYVRLVDELYGKCFCYNWTDNTMRETPNG